MNKILLVVVKVLERKGYTRLTITIIAKAVSVDRKLINLYFESVDNLIETYILSKDYRLSSITNTIEKLKNLSVKSSKDVIENLLLDQLDNFLKNKEMQKAVTWQISDSQ